MVKYVGDASEEMLSARLAYCHKQATEAEQEAERPTSSDVREAYIALPRCLLHLVKKTRSGPLIFEWMAH